MFSKPDVLKPDVLKPDVLKPDVLKPDVLWVYPWVPMPAFGLLGRNDQRFAIP
jgi:hypothetical protein